MISGVYAIIGPSGAYIGQSSNIERRWEYYLWYLTRNQHCAPHLQHAWNKYGSEAFKLEILLRSDSIDLMFKSEQQWIDWYIENSSLYNGRAFAEYPRVPHGYKHVKKMTSGMEGKKHSPETRKRMSESAKGRIISQEQREKISATLRARKRG